MVRTFSEPAIRSVDLGGDVVGAAAPDLPAGRPVDGLLAHVERLRRVIDELAAILDDVD